MNKKILYALSLTAVLATTFTPSIATGSGPVSLVAILALLGTREESIATTNTDQQHKLYLKAKIAKQKDNQQRLRIISGRKNKKHSNVQRRNYNQQGRKR